ncbi:MAG: cation diffusion facilitator family transporter [bacterium]|nr:cation diffusion facilitator family transporter [bacterium]
MTSLLVKKFVKNYEMTSDSKVRTSYGVLASIVGIVCNVILSITKLIIGTIIGSISVTADAFNNLSDAASSIISFIGVKMASRPADKEHPFGHGRYEYISALVVAFLVLQVGFTCFKSAIDKILHPQEVAFNYTLVGILVISILIKVWLGIFNRTLGKRINSTVMKATSADAFGDVLVTSATVASLLISRYSGINIDGYMGIVVSVFVLIAGFNIAKDTLEPLLGEAVSKETYDLITKKVEGYEGIIGSHDLIVHSYGPSHTMATIHAEVPNDMSFEEAHELIDHVEREVLRDENIFLVIHMDPVEVNDEEVVKARRIISKIVKELDDEASIHDFRFANEDERINLIFDLLVPHQYSEEQEKRIQQQIKNLASAYDERYLCVITLEHGFICNK